MIKYQNGTQCSPMKSEIADCGHRERTRHIENGECRDCRGVAKPKRIATYRSPDYRERNAEALAHAEQRSRARVLSGRSARTNSE